MDIQTYTKEPWQWGEIVVNINGLDINFIAIGKYDSKTAIAVLGEVGGETDQLSRIEASRIVACVNACAGITNATLESELVKDRLFKVADLTQQRDELLAALRDIKSRFEDCISGGNGELPEDKPALEIAAAAIAKAEAI